MTLLLTKTVSEYDIQRAPEPLPRLTVCGVSKI